MITEKNLKFFRANEDLFFNILWESPPDVNWGMDNVAKTMGATYFGVDITNRLIRFTMANVVVADDFDWDMFMVL